MDSKRNGNLTGQHLRTLLYQQWSAEQKWKEKIAAVLHSEVTQSLTAIKLHVSQAQTTLGNSARDSKAERHLSAITEITDGIVEHLRDIMQTLRWEILENFGLPEAVGWYLEQVGDHTEIQTDSRHELAEIDEAGEPDKALFTVFTLLVDAVAEWESVESIAVVATDSDGERHIRMKVTGTDLGTLTESLELQPLGTELPERLRMHNGDFSVEPQGHSAVVFFCRIPRD